MKKQPEYVEGKVAFRQFDTAVGRLLGVSHQELARREDAYRRKAERNPNKPGPKPKRRVKRAA